jgi:two-component system, NarL family, response regulator LiaR
VLIVDDHKMLRQALALVLNDLDDMILVGEASNGLEAVNLSASVHPDVILMDLVMDGLDGVAANRVIRANHTNIQVLVFTSLKDPDRIEAALQAGAASYLFKDVGIDQLASAIRSAHHRGLNASNQTARD